MLFRSILSSEELRAIARRLDATPLSGFEQEEGGVLEKACEDLRALLARTERAAFGLSDELQRRFFTHAATPAPVGIDAA